MSRYFDLEKLKEMIEAKAETVLPEHKSALLYISNWFNHLPAADVEPVRHGHWIRTGEYIAYKNLGQTKRMEEKVCSVCGAFAPYTKFGKQYCPPRCYCGAKMDGKENTDADTV